MDFQERFDSSEPMESLDCGHGPPSCGRCGETCIYKMELAFRDDYP